MAAERGASVELLNRIEGMLVWFEKAMILVFGVVMLVSVSLQVFFRYVIPISLPWTEELSIIAFVVIIFYGAALAGYHNRHLGITNVVELLGEKAYVAVWVLKQLALVAFLIVVIVLYGSQTALQGMNSTFAVIRIPIFYLIIQIPIFGLLSMFHALMALLRRDFRPVAMGGREGR
jgi:TRAP-type transport system small permease protein